jgi:hypothetical protein
MSDWTFNLLRIALGIVVVVVVLWFVNNVQKSQQEYREQYCDQLYARAVTRSDSLIIATGTRCGIR